MSPWVTVDNDPTRIEIVKCVVVGDTAVGKTRLICAHACDTYLDLSQAVTTHIPTVWAIDQYRIHKEVLKRSWKVIDGVNVSLRLWDTFGDHEKDRKFAYARSDVVLLCFSVANLQSLRNCKTKWYSEIRNNCPQTPIILVGCKNDLRHIYRDKNFLKLCREKSPHLKTLQESDITTPDQGRNFAKEIGASYYEASVLTPYGIKDVFENAVRVALIFRRERRFLAQRLKNIQVPSIQRPFCPPPPPKPSLDVPKSTYASQLMDLFNKGYYADVELLASGTDFKAHTYILAAASPYFRNLFNNMSYSKTKQIQKSIHNFSWMSSIAMECYLRFIYSGYLDIRSSFYVQQLAEIAEITNVEELKTLLDNLYDEEDYLSYAHESQARHMCSFQKNLQTICLNDSFATDVIFELEDGKCSAHRAVLITRSEVMAAMLNGHFKESSAEIISLPGVFEKYFRQLLTYIYTDQVDESVQSSYLPLLELANRQCMFHLTALLEKHAVLELTRQNDDNIDISEYVCLLLETSQIHNAYQLSEWCQYFIIVNYQDISTKSTKPLWHLHPENQAYLNKNRWPPLYYLKELEYYERNIREKENKEKPQNFLKWKKAAKINSYQWFRGKNKEHNIQE